MHLIQAPNLQLVSLHIPKTAGTSFRSILKQVYGAKAVVRFDIINGEAYIEQKLFKGDKLPSHIKVIHGHFCYADLIQKVQLPAGVKKITWLRHPVKRTVSNYFYLCSMLKHYLQEEKNKIDILSKMQRTILEYAGDDNNKNRMSVFLRGSSLQDYDFVGLVEHFDEHLKLMSAKLGWPADLKPIHHNETDKTKYSVNKEVELKIEEWNKADMELYALALKDRNN